ncbi:MAG: mechanosensitive ion channel family protein [Bacteroidota bacterium]
MQLADSASVALSDTAQAALDSVQAVLPDSVANMAEDSLAAPVPVAETASGLIVKLQGWVEHAILLLPNIVVAFLVVVVFAMLARLARRVVQSVLSRLTTRAPQAGNVTNLLGTLAYIVVLAAGTFIALKFLRLDGLVTTLLAGAGVVGLALGFAFQDIASNFISGVLMAVNPIFLVGEIIETNGHMGSVREISLRTTVIDTFDGRKVALPNAKVFGEPLVNYSARRERRIDLACGVGYGDDLGNAQKVAVEAVKSLDMLKKGRPVTLFYTEFGDSSINFVVSFWVDFSKQVDFLEAQSEAIKAIKQAFDEKGVTIPFPIRTLDFDPNGGVELSKMLGSLGASGNGA